LKVTADDVAQLLAGNPPRRVPAHLQRAANRYAVTWGTVLAGLFFTLFSIPFLWGFFPWRALDEMRLAGGLVARGTVYEVADARMKVNGRRIMEYRFQYTDAKGAERKGAAYAVSGRWSQGEDVAIRYLENAPELAVIEGARLTKAGWIGSFVIIFPVVGLGMMAWFFIKRGQTGWLLRNGQVAEVDIVSVESTNTQVNKQTVYKIVLAAPHLPAGGRQTIRRINLRDVELAEEHAAQKQPVFVLYEPRKPGRILFPEALIEGDSPHGGLRPGGRVGQ
jgi:hypothetical protein